MCLSKKTNWCKEKEGYGWKVFSISHNTLHGVFYYKGDNYTLNKFYRATFGLIQAEDRQRYSCGFHILKTRAEARKYKEYIHQNSLVIRKVKYRKLVSSGIEEPNIFLKQVWPKVSVIVAKEMLILKPTRKVK
jgi:hypothetical protein